MTWADGLSTLLTNVNQKGKDDEDERDRTRGEKIEAAGQPGGRNRKREKVNAPGSIAMARSLDLVYLTDRQMVCQGF